MSNRNANKPGYKHTPLGWIPEEWEVKELKELGIFVGGGTPNTSINRYWGGGIPWVSPKDMKCDNIQETQDYLTDEGIRESSTNLLPKNSVLIVTRSGILRNFVPLALNSVPVAINQDLKGLKVINSVDSVFVFQYLKYSNDRLLLETAKIGTTVESLDFECLKKFKITLPSQQEQAEISQILMKWDYAISTTEKLISSLQRRNKGLMQQLLTGKKRIPLFKRSKWKRLPAKKVFENVSIKNNTGEVLLSATQDKGIVPRDMLEVRVTMPTGDITAFKLVEKGDFVISLRSFQGGIEYSEYRGIVSPAYIVLKPKIEINVRFFKHYFKSYDFVGHLAVAVIGIRDGKQISYEDFSSISLPFPSLEEQQEIADVLDKAISECSYYEQILKSTKQQKSALLQKLLTGEIRVNPQIPVS